jgi:hypothetical protein
MVRNTGKSQSLSLLIEKSEVLDINLYIVHHHIHGIVFPCRKATLLFSLLTHHTSERVITHLMTFFDATYGNIFYSVSP